jgi:glutathione S-transferase
MRYWAWTADEVHLSLARLTHMRLLKAAMNHLTADEIKTMLAHTPVPEKRERWNILAKDGYSEEQLANSLDNVLFIFRRMEEELGGRGPWLAGASFSLGDISMAAIVHRIYELYPDRLDRSAFPVVSAWWDRLMARPAASYVYSGSTDEVPRRPPKKSIAGIAEFHV